MESPELGTLLVIAAVMVAAPLLVNLPIGFRLPVVVVEVALGIAVGPHVLDIIEVDAVITFLGQMGLAFLFFMAGLEMDFRRIRGKPVQLGLGGWLLSLAIALAAAYLLHAFDFIKTPQYIAVALCTTAIGTLLPILRDAKELDSRFGTFVMAAGAAGEFGPIILISLLLTGDRSETGSAILLLSFTLVAVAAAAVAMRLQPPWFVGVLRRTMNTSGQLPVRLCLLILVALVYLAGEFGLDVILGAFAAGIVVGLASHGELEHSPLYPKLEAIGFGFLVPVFFVLSGMKFDLEALVDSPTTILRVPVFLALFLLVRGLPALLYRGQLAARERLSLALFSATALPLIVAVTEIGVSTGRIRTDNAAALVGAGMVSVLVFPLVALALRRAPRPRAAPEEPAAVPAGAD